MPPKMKLFWGLSPRFPPQHRRAGKRVGRARRARRRQTGRAGAHSSSDLALQGILRMADIRTPQAGAIAVHLTAPPFCPNKSSNQSPNHKKSSHSRSIPPPPPGPVPTRSQKIIAFPLNSTTSAGACPHAIPFTGRNYSITRHLASNGRARGNPSCPFT